MRSNRTGYLMAMMAGLAIVGASTGGAVIASSHHNQTVAAAAAVAPSNSGAAATGPTAAVGTPTPVASAPVSSQAPAPASGSPATSGPAASAPTASAAAATVPATRATATTAPAIKVAAVPPPVTTAPATKVAATTAKTVAAAALEFKDGKYSATGSYNSPGGIEKLGVTVTIAADKVTTSDLDLEGGAGLSHSFQSAFQSGYSSQVIGKKISTISLGAVAGSSLTGMGFNDALKQIESAARLQK